VLDVAKVQGRDITRATALRSPVSYWLVNVTFDGAGSKQFATMTTSMYDHYGSSYGSSGNPRDQVAIVLDGVVIISPEIDRPITGGTASITSIPTQSAARQLAADLQTGALPVDFHITVISTTATPS
jgi:preprotein translocase subunit SecD